MVDENFYSENSPVYGSFLNYLKHMHASPCLDVLVSKQPPLDPCNVKLLGKFAPLKSLTMVCEILGTCFIISYEIIMFHSTNQNSDVIPFGISSRRQQVQE